MGRQLLPAAARRVGAVDLPDARRIEVGVEQPRCVGPRGVGPEQRRRVAAAIARQQEALERRTEAHHLHVTPRRAAAGRRARFDHVGQPGAVGRELRVLRAAHLGRRVRRPDDVAAQVEQAPVDVEAAAAAEPADRAGGDTQSAGQVAVNSRGRVEQAQGGVFVAVLDGEGDDRAGQRRVGRDSRGGRGRQNGGSRDRGRGCQGSRRSAGGHDDGRLSRAAACP